MYSEKVVRERRVRDRRIRSLFPWPPLLVPSCTGHPLKRVSRDNPKTLVNIFFGMYCYRPLSTLAARLRGHKQRKLNDYVYSFLLFVSSRPHCEAEFNISKVAY